MKINLTTIHYILLKDDINSLTSYVDDIKEMAATMSGIFKKVKDTAIAYEATQCHAFLSEFGTDLSTELGILELALASLDNGPIFSALSNFENVSGISFAAWAKENPDESSQWVKSLGKNIKDEYKTIQKQNITLRKVIRKLHYCILNPSDIFLLIQNDKWVTALANENETKSLADYFFKIFDQDVMSTAEVAKNCIHSAKSTSALHSLLYLFNLILKYGEESDIELFLHATKERISRFPIIEPSILGGGYQVEDNKNCLINLLNEHANFVQLETNLVNKNYARNLEKAITIILKEDVDSKIPVSSKVLEKLTFELHSPFSEIEKNWLPALIKHDQKVSEFLKNCDIRYLEDTLNSLDAMMDKDRFFMERLIAARGVRRASELLLWNNEGISNIKIHNLVKRFSSLSEGLSVDEFKLTQRKVKSIPNINAALRIKREKIIALTLIQKMPVRDLIEGKINFDRHVFALLSSQISVTKILEMASTERQKQFTLKQLGKQ